MQLCKTSAFAVLTVVTLCLSTTVDGDIDNVSDEEDASRYLSGLSPVLLPAVDPLSSSHTLSAVVAQDLEINQTCRNLATIFHDRYIAYADCLVKSARPVEVCLNCFEGYALLSEIYANISNDQVGPGNCRDSLLRSDRLMLIYLLYGNLQNIWRNSACEQCVNTEHQTLKNDTLYFMNERNQSISCFDQYKQENHSDLCVKCKSKYESLNVLYGGMEKNGSLCIDIEDAMNVTRRLWSKNYNCIAPREGMIPVIAVSCFMLFLPIIFYLSSYLHSEQKKLKLIHPKRAKSNNSLMNIQDKFS
ncbi:osteopetrosis-associated transmembrane protein 1 [Gadus macrocephalus]|uniref:osteopetrosis-associated transmembrane protein 1 n=1 Tax=Gadus macrocephalus TaxID=80720 RepID=UPI0028CB512B|nr:osteopetrosis-associated transmembrane protein 1 [Gadus macrocephalus]